MRVNVDVYTEVKIWNISFFKKREAWLPGTGIYVEFILKDQVSKELSFKVVSLSDKDIIVRQFAWNKFFINILKSGDIIFSLYGNRDVLIEEKVSFSVVEISAPIIFSFPYLLDLSVSDIRLFCNKVSKRLVNGTRVILYSPSFLRRFCDIKFNFDEMEHFLDMIFSIVTERGLVLFITVFDEYALYTEELLFTLQKHFLFLVDKMNKFKIVWDLSCGTHNKFMCSMIDLILSRIQYKNIRVIFPPFYSSKSKFKSNFEFVGSIEDIYKDSSVCQILRINSTFDFFNTRSLARRVSCFDQGIELINLGIGIQDIKFSLAKALYYGYTDEQTV